PSVATARRGWTPAVRAEPAWRLKEAALATNNLRLRPIIRTRPPLAGLTAQPARKRQPVPRASFPFGVALRSHYQGGFSPADTEQTEAISRARAPGRAG